MIFLRATIRYVYFMILVAKACSLYQVTRNRVIREGIFSRLESMEWITCTQMCDQLDDCVSYNFGLDGMNRGICEFSKCASNLCDKEIGLLFLQGMVVHQIKKAKLDAMCSQIPTPSTQPTLPATPRDCMDVFLSGGTVSKIYDVDPDGSGLVMPVLCDQDIEGGGWTVLQKRTSGGGEDFFKLWTDYVSGFGSYDVEFWIGLDRMHRLTASRRNMKLRIELIREDGAKAYSEYTGFWIASNADNYKLNLVFEGGTAGDSLTMHHNGKPFSAKDKDNDNCAYCSCAERFTGAWWFDGTGDECMSSDLNGRNISWQSWNFVLKGSEMKIRPVP